MLDGDGEASSEANVEPFCFEPARAVAYCIIRGLAIVSSSKLVSACAEYSSVTSSTSVFPDA